MAAVLSFHLAWYEFYPANSVSCSMSVGASDFFYVQVNNEASSGGNSNLYDITIQDQTAQKVCSVSGHNFSSMGTPYYADFIAERPTVSGSLARLPKFSSFSILGDMYYSGSSVLISTPYSNGWYNTYVMTNGGNTNINLGSVATSGSSIGTFTETWSTSSGT